jgi:NAD(P)-dependent dehydrogenase (short-subunit alcohol dehydrogenase family)
VPTDRTTTTTAGTTGGAPTAETTAVLVTGAGRGLGAVVTERLAHEGYLVFAGARRGDAPAGDRIVPVELDVTSPDSIARAADAVAARLDGAGLGALVNNAAVLHAGPVETSTAEQIDELLRTNVAGPLLTTRWFLPLLRRGRGRIVNMGSINGQLPLPYWAAYSASKAALASLSDALRLELAPWDIGVTVLTLGAFATDIRARAQSAWVADPDSPYEAARRTNERLVAMFDSSAGDPGEVADAVVAVLGADPPPPRVAVGPGIDDLLALAAQPPHVRDAALAQLLAAADGAGTRG